MKKLLWILPLFLIFCGLGIAYMYGYDYSRQYFMPNTTVNGQDVSKMTAGEAETLLNQHSEEITVIQRKNGSSETITETIDLIECGYTETYDTEALIKAQDHALWMKFLVSSTDLTIEKTGSSVDSSRLQEAISALYCMQEENTTEPTDAYIQYADGEFSIVPSSDGCKVDQEQAEKDILSAVNARESSVDITADYVKADVQTDDPDLIQELNDYNQIFLKKVTMPMYGSVAEVVPEEELRKLILVDENFEFSVNEEELDYYIEQLYTKYSTEWTKRNFTTTSGEVIQVGSDNDIFGYDMSKLATKDSLREALLSTEDVTVQTYWDNSGFWDDTLQNDIGTTYIEISRDDQHLWYYVDGKLELETDVVTGMKGQMDTPEGVFKVWAKRRDVVLTAEDYATPVEMWMPITWDGIGIHDASWRSTFGGDIYLTNGSHGCINVPYDKVTILFNVVEIGTPVVIY